MVSRVFDRRGRGNWSDEKRQSEDQRVRDRRAKSDRRTAQRRQGGPWPAETNEVDLRVDERRKQSRRTTSEPPPVDQNPPPISVESSLLEGITTLSVQTDGFLIVSNVNKSEAGVLSDRGVVRALAEDGSDALAKPISRYLSKLKP